MLSKAFDLTNHDMFLKKLLCMLIKVKFGNFDIILAR